ncbi:hypothetical protein IFR05_015110 [Cadophora sp. M221]|nr:hypothetical protein IFR05_015110 [Cadophora sp. M221]
MGPRSTPTVHPKSDSMHGSQFSIQNSTASFIPTTGGYPTQYSYPATKTKTPPSIRSNEPKLTLNQALEGAREGPNLAKEFISMNGHRTGNNSKEFQGHRISNPGHLHGHGKQFYDQRSVPQYGKHPTDYYHSPQLGMGSGAPPQFSHNSLPPTAPHDAIHHTNTCDDHGNLDPDQEIFIGENPSGVEWVLPDDPLYAEYVRRCDAERERIADEDRKKRGRLLNLPASKEPPCGHGEHSGNRVQTTHVNRKYAGPIPETGQILASESTQLRKELSEEEKTDIIQNSVKAAVAAFFNGKEPPEETERRLVQSQSSTLDNVDTSSQPKELLVRPELFPIPPRNESKVAAKNSQGSQRSEISVSGPGAAKRRRGRPTKLEQKERDQANPEGAFRREQVKAAKKAAKQGGKQAGKGIKGKKGVQGIPQSSPTFKIEAELEVGDLYSADAEEPKQAARKRPSIIIIDQDPEENLNSTDGDTRIANTKTSIHDGLNTPKKRGVSATSQPAAKRRKVLSNPKKLQAKSQEPKFSIRVIDTENEAQYDGLEESDNNEREDVGVMDRSPPISRAPSSIETLFGLEYSREHRVQEIQPNKVYYDSSHVRQVPTRVTHFLTCSWSPHHRRTSRPAQQELCVKPNIFCSLDNKEFVKLFKFLKESLSTNSILLIARSEGNESDLQIIEGLVVLVCTMIGKEGVRLPPRSTATAMKWMARKFSAGFTEAYTELLDDFDFFSHYGRGSQYWPSASQQWKDFVDAVGETNKRRKAGPNLQYIEVKEFGYTLRKFVDEAFQMPLVVPRPFNKRMLEAHVAEWWKAKKAEGTFSIACTTAKPRREKPSVVEPAREEWPGTRDLNEPMDWQEAAAEYYDMEMDDLIGQVMGCEDEDSEDDISLSDEERSWTIPATEAVWVA